MTRCDGFLVRLSLSPRSVTHLSKGNVDWTTRWRPIDMAHSCFKALQSVSAPVRIAGFLFLIGIRQCSASELQR